VEAFELSPGAKPHYIQRGLYTSVDMAVQNELRYVISVVREIFHVQHCLHFDDIFSLVSDPRTAKWPLMSSPFPTLAICLSYIYVVKVLGPRLMENRKPMELRKVLVYYNLFQVLFSIWLFLEVSFSNTGFSRIHELWAGAGRRNTFLT
jgi:hypothetical protein